MPVRYDGSTVTIYEITSSVATSAACRRVNDDCRSPTEPDWKEAAGLRLVAANSSVDNSGVYRVIGDLPCALVSVALWSQ
jgi:hypothetical protein